MSAVPARTKLVVYGASGHGKVVADAAERSGAYEVVGFVDDDRERSGEPFLGRPVLGGPEAIAALGPDVTVALGIGANDRRRQVCAQLGLAPGRLATVVHPTASVSAGAVLGEGTFVGPQAIVHVDARVGRGCILNSGCVVEHDDVIGDWVHISPNATLGGGVTIGDGAQVGLGAAVLPFVAVGPRAQVGAGAVVTRPLPEGVTAVGVPARIIPRSHGRVAASPGATEAPAAPGRLWLSPPHLDGSEWGLVREALDGNWVAPVGPHLEAFEREMCLATGAAHAAAVSSGTAALHLAIQLAGVRPGDDVLCSTFTFAASAFPIVYAGARPVFVDSERATWNMDPALLADELDRRARAGRLPRAVVLVHLYGQSADLDPIVEACDRHGVALIEDAAEALGASYRGAMPGTRGLLGIYSFNGNKIITTSGGGMLVSRDRSLVERARFLATQAKDPAPHYQHSAVGHNYRMSNVLAGIGRGQLRVLADRVARRRRIFGLYRDALDGVPGVTFMPEAPTGRSTRWLTAIEIAPAAFGATREDVRVELERREIESRPVWKPLHLQPVFAGCERAGGAVAEGIFERGLCLPSGSRMEKADVDRVVAGVLHVRRRARAAPHAPSTPRDVERRIA